MGSAGIADDLAHSVWFVQAAVYELVRDADFEQASVQHQSAHGAPALRAGVRPHKQALAGGAVIPDSANQVRRPNPGAGKQDDRVDGVVALHLLKCGAGFFFAGDDNAMLNHLQTRRNQRTLGALHQGVIDERRTHGVLQTIFVNSKHYESDCGLYHRSSK